MTVWQCISLKVTVPPGRKVNPGSAFIVPVFTNLLKLASVSLRVPYYAKFTSQLLFINSMCLLTVYELPKLQSVHTSHLLLAQLFRKHLLKLAIFEISPL